jgi:hypothetical protein
MDPSPYATPRARTGYPTGPSPGGNLPDIGKLLSDTFAEFGDHVGPYLLAGLGFTLVLMPLTFVGVIGLYAGAGVGMVGVFAVAAFLESAGPGQADGAMAALVPILSIGILFLVLLVFVVGLSVAIAPMSASMMRAIAQQQQDGARLLTLTSPFTTITHHAGRVIGVMVVFFLLALVAMALCVFPVLLLPVLFGFTTTMVILHDDVTVTEAFALNLRHVRAHPGWHVSFALVAMLLTLAASQIPVAGLAFCYALYVRAHRELFGDGPRPVLDEIHV